MSGFTEEISWVTAIANAMEFGVVTADSDDMKMVMKVNLADVPKEALIDQIRLLFGDFERAYNEREKLRNAIRYHRDARGDDRCWMDDEYLYKVLPEGYVPPARTEAVEIDRCKAFIATRHHPATEYVSPQRKIEELEAAIEEYKRQELETGRALLALRDEVVSIRDMVVNAREATRLFTQNNIVNGKD